MLFWDNWLSPSVQGRWHATLGARGRVAYITLDMGEPAVSDQSLPRVRSERMQRLRVGITGLAAVLIIVAVATAIGSSVRRSADAANATTPPPVVATLPQTNNAAAPNSEPLAQLGAAPGSKPEPVNESPKK